MMGAGVLLSRALFFAAVVLLSGEAWSLEKIKEAQSRPIFGTVASVDVCYTAEQKAAVQPALDRVWLRFEEINARMSTYDPKSDISALNRAGGKAVVVHADVAGLLRRSQEFSLMTHGAFDVSVGPLLKFWELRAKDGVFPPREDVLAVKAHLGYDKIVFQDDGSVLLLDPSAEISLNAIVPGYAADEGAQILRSAGFQDFFIDAGGEIYAAGVNCQGRSWHIGVRDPLNTGRILEVIALKDEGVSTSGDYEKYFEIRGQRYSHIVNPVTGYPVLGVSSVTVIAPTATEADVLSTALCVLGPQAGTRLINDLGDGFASLILYRGALAGFERFATAGYAKRLMGRVGESPVR